MDATILPLAESAGLLAGKTVNVLLFGEGGHESMQTLTDVRVKREFGVNWLILAWVGGRRTPWGTASCGFAGWKVDETLRQRLRELRHNAELCCLADPKKHPEGLGLQVA